MRQGKLLGNREQRLNLLFDPTKDFHTYSILWNQRQVVSIWNADDWATQGMRLSHDNCRFR
ncbi:putative xyloglucan:xyloglucosyl transferase [Helianthus annuus]|nr:putative xyloglucan:xyloglucosyl transferase [Helianthus annuus]KAJ0529351.1 putative xyloglucan:xyloglucosyl transferase [Helianthus annuus]KAJ0696236.1 putative xyloglucan:xyloglucosyl transferase [Helianthus annuus]